MAFEPTFPEYEKRQYRPVFMLPGPDWGVEAVWEDAYYKSSKRLLEGVARGEFPPAFEGVVGLYLFRHYLELAIKFIIFHSRWLEDAQTNARLEDIDDVKKTHSLAHLWTTAKAECQRIIPPQKWGALDLVFVDQCVADFDGVDPKGELFRYHGPRFGVEKDPTKRAQLAAAIRFDLHVRFEELPAVVEHVHDVLDYLDFHMVETHGQNAEWQDFLDSL